MKLIGLIALIFISNNLYAGTEAVVNFDGENCAAWKTKKTMLLVKSLEPIGKNCSVKAEVQNKDNKKLIKVTIPIKDFNSGEEKRDREVLSILSEKDHPDIIFTTSEIQRIKSITVNDKPVDIKGKIEVKGKVFDILFKLNKKRREQSVYFNAVSVTKYSKLGLKPPSVAGGLVARVKDYLELHLWFNENKIDL